jgi:hypothetical protein
MHNYKGYIILNPYNHVEFFAQYPNGEDMRLRLMCAAPEGSLFFFPEHYPITTNIERRIGHPVAPYSEGYASVTGIMAAIDEWAPIDRRQQAERGAFYVGSSTSPLIKLVEAAL